MEEEFLDLLEWLEEDLRTRLALHAEEPSYDASGIENRLQQTRRCMALLRGKRELF